MPGRLSVTRDRAFGRSFRAHSHRVVFGQPGLYREDPDYYAALVLNHIVGGGSFTSRLYDEVREKRGLAYSVFSYLLPLGNQI